MALYKGNKLLAASVPGKSAYEHALEGGYAGTEQEFNEVLANLEDIEGSIPIIPEAEVGEDVTVFIDPDEEGETSGGVKAGVGSFNGRTGVVVPESGDYTAEMVGAAPAGLKANVNLYVATTGNDETGDGTETNPFRTIQHAIDSVPKLLNGNTAKITVGNGTFNENISIVGFCEGIISLYGKSNSSTIIVGNVVFSNCSNPIISTIKIQGKLSCDLCANATANSITVVSSDATAIGFDNCANTYVAASSVTATGTKSYEGAISFSKSAGRIISSTIESGTVCGISVLYCATAHIKYITNNASTKTATYYGFVYDGGSDR